MENTELNDLRKIICLKKSKVFLKEFQFVMSLKIWQSKAYTVCYASISMKRHKYVTVTTMTSY